MKAAIVESPLTLPDITVYSCESTVSWSGTLLIVNQENPPRTWEYRGKNGPGSMRWFCWKDHSQEDHCQRSGYVWITPEEAMALIGEDPAMIVSEGL